MAIDTNKIRDKLNQGGVKRVDVLALCDEIDLLRAESTPTPPAGKTVRVKVAVAVDKKIRWNAAGYGDASDAYLAHKAHENCVLDDAPVYWLTADLPIPEEVTVAAKVEVDRE